MSFIISAVKIIFLLGFLIIIHESGHFFLAKACKVKVREFAIGFGPKIFSRQGSETKYTLRLIPFGGYVDMLGEAERENTEGSFSEASVIKRLSIVLAGPIVNIVFGLFVYFLLMSFSNDINITNVINEVEYSENITILQKDDEILEINNEKIRFKTDIDKIVSSSEGKTLEVKLKRNNEILNVKVDPIPIVKKSLGTYFSSSSDLPKIKYIQEGTPIENTGIFVNDIITKINGIEIKVYSDIASVLENIEGNKVNLEIKRDDELLNFEVELLEYTQYVLGIYLKVAEDTFINNTYYAFLKTSYFMSDILNNVKAIFAGKVNVNQMVGPIGISEMVVETKGAFDFIYLISLISLSLGVTNLLPIPALDGGRVVLLLIEAIRRKPLKEEVEMKIQMIGFTLLILFSIYISYKDILRIF